MQTKMKATDMQEWNTLRYSIPRFYMLHFILQTFYPKFLCYHFVWKFSKDLAVPEVSPRWRIQGIIIILISSQQTPKVLKMLVEWWPLQNVSSLREIQTTVFSYNFRVMVEDHSYWKPLPYIGAKQKQNLCL